MTLTLYWDPTAKLPNHHGWMHPLLTIFNWNPECDAIEYTFMRAVTCRSGLKSEITDSDVFLDESADVHLEALNTQQMTSFIIYTIFLLSKYGHVIVYVTFSFSIFFHLTPSIGYSHSSTNSHQK